MPLNLTKKYNQLLDIVGLGERDRTASLRCIFNRDIQENPAFTFMGKAIFPTPKENGILAMEALFDHLTCKEVDKEARHREFDLCRSQRLHWINHHVKQTKPDNMLYFSVDEPHGKRTYIYDIDERYVVILEPLRDGKSYYLLTAYPLQGKDAARDKILAKYRKRRLPEIL